MTDRDLDVIDMRYDDTVDVVEAIYGSGHQRYCNYVPEINRHTNLIYCRTCTCQIGSLFPASYYEELKVRRSGE